LRLVAGRQWVRNYVDANWTFGRAQGFVRTAAVQCTHSAPWAPIVRVETAITVVCARRKVGTPPIFKRRKGMILALLPQRRTGTGESRYNPARRAGKRHISSNVRPIEERNIDDG
jgi:hypothetical protein